MLAGKTKLEIGTRIITTEKWHEESITGTITHPFGCFGNGAMAVIRIDKKFHKEHGKIGNLYKGDFNKLGMG